MSEHLSQNPEGESFRRVETAENPHHKHESKEHAEQHEDQSELAKHAHETIDKVALSKDKVSVGELEKSDSTIDSDNIATLKKGSYTRMLHRIRSKLSGPDKSFSRVIHRPSIEKVSDTTAKTIGRSSGIIGGSIAAITVSLFLLYVGKHYGLNYNFTIICVVFVVGFLLGVAIEVGFKLSSGKKNDL